MKPFHLKSRWQVFIAILLVIFWVKGHQHISQMDKRFFQPSLQGIQGLFLYEIGNYKGAAGAYRAHFMETDDWETSSDPGVDALLRDDLFLAAAISESDLKTGQNPINAALTLGEVALTDGRDDEALAWFNAALENEEDQFDALLLASILQTRNGNIGEAIHLINRALRHHRADTRITTFFWVLDAMGDLLESPDHSQHSTLLAHYFRYLRIFDITNGKKALSFATAGLEGNDHLESAYLTMGIIFHKMNKIEDARSAYKKALERDPEFSEAYRRMAKIYSERGQLAKEYQMTKIAYETAPKDRFYIQAYQDHLVNKLGDYYQALVLTEKLLVEDPQNINLIKSAASYLRFIGKEEQAIQYYEKALIFYPNDPSLYEGLGYSLIELEKYDAAFEAFQAALSINNTRANAYAGLSYVYNKTNKKLDAIETLEAAFRHGYRSNIQRINLCTLYHTESLFEKAARCLRRVLTAEPRNAYAGNLLTYTLKNLADQ
ncbi:MAG: tetratricopeptide repeat protein [Nitrospirae bacterium]|nr:tetratricopeptide repeat protein [Candidatus Manganitrophaceae bacterium]